MTSNKKCFIRHDGKICKEPIFITIKVKVYHPTTKRTTWQTWDLCESHFADFFQKKGDGYCVVYPGKKEKGECPVIGFRLPKPEDTIPNAVQVKEWIQSL